MIVRRRKGFINQTVAAYAGHTIYILLYNEDMTMRTIDLSPLYRHFIGSDHLASMIVDKFFDDYILLQNNLKPEHHKQQFISAMQQVKTLQSDYQSLKKRTEQQKKQIEQQIFENVINHFFPFLDQLLLSISHYENNKTEHPLAKGLSMIYEQLMQSLKKNYNLKKIKTVGEKFDFKFHEAVAYQKSNQQDEDTIIEELSPGYCLNEKVIRYAKVKVSRK